MVSSQYTVGLLAKETLPIVYIYDHRLCTLITQAHCKTYYHLILSAQTLDRAFSSFLVRCEHLRLGSSEWPETTKAPCRKSDAKNEERYIFLIVLANLLSLHSSSSTELWQWNYFTFKANRIPRWRH